MAGLPGALLSCLAMLLPPLLILAVQLVFARIARRPETQGALDGVVLAIVGFNAIVLSRIFLGNGPDLAMVAVALVSAALAVSRRVSSVLILALAAAVGFLMG